MKQYLALLVGASTSAMLWIGTARADTQSCCGNKIRWPSPDVTMRWCTTSWNSSNAAVARIGDAAEEWNDLFESNLTIWLANTSNCFVGNQTNEIWYSFIPDDDDLVLMDTLTDYKGNGSPCPEKPCCNGCLAPELREADIVVYDRFRDSGPITWTYGVPNGAIAPPTTGATNWFIVVMQHEMGHAIGLTHTLASGMVRMTPFNPFGGWFYNSADPVQPLGGDRADVSGLYYVNSPYSDLYMANTQTMPSGEGRPLDYNPATDLPNFYPRVTERAG